MDLRGYEHAKFALAELLRAAMAQGALGNQFEERSKDLFARLAEDRFNLMIAGRFNRGKSSLINAIIGADRLPTGILPLTSVITTVCYGTEEKAVLKYKGRRLASEVKLEDLPRHITQHGNPGNEEGIATAELQIPSEILRRGFHFIDTPGLGSAIAENSETTEAFLPEADALLLVTSYESPLSEEEMRVVEAAFRWGLRLFVVVNKRDLIPSDEQEEVRTFLGRQLGKIFGGSSPQIFSVSARLGLQAKRAGDHDLLQQSGLEELERTLVDFLLDHKRQEFLLRMAGRISSLVWELPQSPRKKSLLKEVQDIEKQFRQATQKVQSDSVPINECLDIQHVRSCEICVEVADAVWNFLRGYQYDLSRSADTRAQFARRLGFCSFHSWEYQAIASPYGISTGYPPLLDHIAEALRLSNASDANPHASDGHSLSPEDDCVLCEIRTETETYAVRRLADKLSTKSTGSLDVLSAVCLPHMGMLASEIKDKEIKHKLIERQADLLERFSEDMRRYAIKHNGVRRFLASKEEEAAARRAIHMVAGRQSVNFAGTQARKNALRTVGGSARARPFHRNEDDDD